METYQEKISLLQELIDFAIVDGQLHDKEYDFIEMIAYELEIDKQIYLKLFKGRKTNIIIKDEFRRIYQFYRLALLMHIDGVLHKKELIKINEIGISMGLNPFAIKRILYLMKKKPSRMIDEKILLAAFQEQHN
ncbi:excinuclease ABC subunit B [uncultured Flavobacterium sp.]|uniref:excinuclease ABC subunit B n=1 Tax=uncultured Flavobacterium sp. TaxID=165435 RepID=UPI0030CA2A26